MRSKVYRPTKAAMEEIRRAAQEPIGPDNPHNAFLLSKETGEIMIKIHLSKDDYVRNRPPSMYIIDLRGIPGISLKRLIEYELETADLQLQADNEIDQENETELEEAAR